jgi:hypothetical protein
MGRNFQSDAPQAMISAVQRNSQANQAHTKRPDVPIAGEVGG